MDSQRDAHSGDPTRSPGAPPGGNGQPEQTSAASGPQPLDPFDPARLRLTQNFVTSVGVKKAIVTIPVRKPAKEWFIQTHPDPAYRIETAVLELKEDREL